MNWQRWWCTSQNRYSETGEPMGWYCAGLQTNIDSPLSPGKKVSEFFAYAYIPKVYIVSVSLSSVFRVS